ncbi:MAG: c-type cytochrome [Novosphingobium sp.]|uniref:c-type cytochrome n=1 Tax=Novosphingobium sp. TaxID=1874826 RepID=UPI0032B7A731
MRTYRGHCAALALVLGLAACGSPPEDKGGDTATPVASDTTAATPAATTAAGGKPTAFAQCAVCHSVEPGKNGVGPSLAGVFGAKAGQVAGYAYTDANKNSGLTWDEATLDEYLTAPAKKVPGTKMTFAGYPDAAKRKEVIEYLKTLK